MRPFFGLFLAALLVSGAGTPPQAESSGNEKPEDILLRGELLELSSGELDKALEIYESLSSDDNAAPAIRARALLNQARCYRKRGELGKARKILEELLSRFPKERRVLRRARIFLRELREGKTSNPDFDWLGELRRNPEINVRIFDYIMDLVESDEKAQRASRQLLALGPIALPMLEQVVGTSRDSEHRRRLALILLHLGKFEYLKTAFPPDLDYWKKNDPFVESFVENLRSFNETEKKTLREALLKDPEIAKAGAFRDFLLLVSGFRKDLPACLKNLESHIPNRLLESFLLYLAGEEEAARTMAQRILDPNCPPRAVRIYVNALEDKAPNLLTAKHYVSLISVAGEYDRPFGKLEELGGLKLLLEAPNKEKVLKTAYLRFYKIFLHQGVKLRSI